MVTSNHTRLPTIVERRPRGLLVIHHAVDLGHVLNVHRDGLGSATAGWRTDRWRREIKYWRRRRQRRGCHRIGRCGGSGRSPCHGGTGKSERRTNQGLLGFGFTHSCSTQRSSLPSRSQEAAGSSTTDPDFYTGLFEFRLFLHDTVKIKTSGFNVTCLIEHRVRVYVPASTCRCVTTTLSLALGNWKIT